MNKARLDLRSFISLGISIFAFVFVCEGNVCFAQATAPAVATVDRTSYFGYTDNSDWTGSIFNQLIASEQWALSESMVRRWIDESRSTTKSIQLNNELILLKAKQRLSKADHSIQYASIRQDILKDSAAVTSKWESSFHPQSPLPNLDDTKLYLEFGTLKAAAELSRFLTAAKLATVGNKSLDTSALQSVQDNIEALDKLQNRVESRVSELSKSPSTTDSQLWINELYRLINEISLQKIDMLAIQMDQLARADEADRVASAANLKAALDELSGKLGGDQADNPQLNLLRARTMAVLGESDAALQLLNASLEKIPAPSLRDQNRFLAIEIMLNQASADSMDQARGLLLKLLGEGSSVSPALALAVFRYNLLHSQGKAAQSTGEETSFVSSEDLGRSMMADLSSAELIKQKEAIRAKYGNYWMLRAEAFLLQNSANASSKNSPSFGGAELLDAQVRQDLMAGRYKDAIGRLETIEQSAVGANKLDQAFETARKRNALLHKLLIQQEKSAESNSTRTARVGIAKRCLDTSTKYPGVADAHKEFLQAILIAKEAVSSDAEINKLAVSFIVNAVRSNIPLFADTESAKDVMTVAELILSSQKDYQGIAQIWEQIAVEQSKSGKQDGQIARRHRAVFRTICELNKSPPDLPTNQSTAPDNQRLAQFDTDDAAIAVVCMSLYWSDLLVPERDISGAKNAIDHDKTLPWIASLLKTKDELTRSAGSMSPIYSFDDSNPTEQLEKLVYRTLWCRMLCEHYLNREGDLPQQVIDEVSAEYTNAKSSSGLLAFVSAGMSNITIRNRAIWAVLHSKLSKDIDQMKKFTSDSNSTDSVIWYGRIQTPLIDTRNRDAINILNNITKREKVGTTDWCRAKADYIYALKKSNELDKARKEFTSVVERVPQIAVPWKQSIEQLLK